MRVATAFFAGVGTVVVAIGAGLGGGLLLGDIMSPQQPKHQSSEVTRLEQRSSPQPIPAMNGASQPVPYMAAPQVAATVGEASAQPQQQSQQQQPQQTQQQPQQVQPQVQQASTQSAEPKPQPERNAPAQSAAAAAAPAANAEPSAAHAAPDDSFAKAREADVKRDGRRADDRRKADRRQQWDERRQQWAEKRKRPRQDDDLGDVEASVREATESRPVFGREQRLESRGPGFFGSRE